MKKVPFEKNKGLNNKQKVNKRLINMTINFIFKLARKKLKIFSKLKILENFNNLLIYQEGSFCMTFLDQ